jgi:PhzF family phenazine biosynthesis protein
MADDVLRYAAFTDRPDGGNPAGVVLEAAGMSDEEMRAIAAELGYSESAFLDGDDLRYFSPLAEVPFCGHATVATAVALAERDGPGDRVFNTRNGPVPVSTRRDDQGRVTVTLTSVPPRIQPLDDADLDEILAALGWAREISNPSSRRASASPASTTRSSPCARASGSPTSTTTSTAWRS